MIYLVHCPALYNRPGIYTAGADEHLRFLLLTRAAIETCQRMGFAPQIFHCNDWHTAFAPLYLRSVYAWDRLFAADPHGAHDPQHRLPGHFLRGRGQRSRARRRAATCCTRTTCAQGRINSLQARHPLRGRHHDGEPDLRTRNLHRRATAWDSRPRCGRAARRRHRHPERRRLLRSGIPQTDPHLPHHYRRDGPERQDKNKQHLLQDPEAALRRAPAHAAARHREPPDGAEGIRSAVRCRCHACCAERQSAPGRARQRRGALRGILRAPAARVPRGRSSFIAVTAKSSHT